MGIVCFVVVAALGCIVYEVVKAPGSLSTALADAKADLAKAEATVESLVTAAKKAVYRKTGACPRLSPGWKAIAAVGVSVCLGLILILLARWILKNLTLPTGWTAATAAESAVILFLASLTWLVGLGLPAGALYLVLK
ncbi:MAG: hypothetical protein ACLQVA_04855 [Candidatus Brocadiia bacterium]